MLVLLPAPAAPQESPNLPLFLRQRHEMGCCQPLPLKRLKVYSTLNSAWGKAFPRIQASCSPGRCCRWLQRGSEGVGVVGIVAG